MEPHVNWDEVDLVKIDVGCGKIVWQRTPRGKHDLHRVREFITKRVRDEDGHLVDKVVWREPRKRSDVGAWHNFSQEHRDAANKRARREA